MQKIDNGQIYAMKILKKAALVARKQVAHTKTERKVKYIICLIIKFVQVLEDIDHPFIVSLRFAFQTEDKVRLRAFGFYVFNYMLKGIFMYVFVHYPLVAHICFVLCL